MAGGSVSYQIRVLDEATKELKNISKGFGNLNKTAKDNSAGLGKLNKAFGVLKGFFIGGLIIKGFQAIGNKLKEVSEAWKTQETAVIKLESALKATGGALGITSSQLQKMAAEMSNVTGISDEAVINAQALMTTFTKVGKDVFPMAINSAADMSAMFGQDLQQSVIQLGTALNDPIAGIGRLKRIGISFSEDQKQMIAGFMAVNDVASAQKVIIDELGAEFGGVAEAMGQGPIGAMNQLKNALVDLNEEWGRTFLESGVFQSAINKAKTVISGFMEWLRKKNDERDYNKGTADDSQTVNALQSRITDVNARLDALQKLADRQYGGDITQFGTLYTHLRDELNNLIKEIGYAQMNISGGAESAAITSQKASVENNLLDELKTAMDYYHALPRTELEKLAMLQEEIASAQMKEDTANNAEARTVWGMVVDKLQLQADEIKKSLAEKERESAEASASALEKPFRDALAYYNSLPKTEEEELAEVKQEIERLYMLTQDTTGVTHDLYVSSMQKLQLKAEEMAESLKTVAYNTESSGSVDFSGFSSAEYFDDLFNAGGGLKAALSGSIAQFQELITAGNPLIAVAVEIASQFKSIGQLMAGMGTILNSLMSVIGPAVDAIFAPLVGILAVIGKTLGAILIPALQILGPVISFISEAFLLLYNYAIVPLANGLIMTFNLIYNGFIAVIRGIITALNYIPFVHISKPSYRDIDQGTLDTISMEDLINAGNESMDYDSSGSAGTGASYTAGRTLNIDVTVNTEVIAGDLGIRELALWIRDEITAAESLGM